MGERSADLGKYGIKTFQTYLNDDLFNQEISEISPDIVIFDRFFSFEQFAWRVKEHCPDACLVLDAEDLHCLRHARKKLFKNQIDYHQMCFDFMSSASIYDKPNELFNDIALREIACIQQADLTITLSSFEYKLLVDIFGVKTTNLLHLPFFGHAPADSHIETRPNSFDDRKDFVFIGSFRHAPNVDSVRILKHWCWPQIRQKLKAHEPNITCHVFGSYLSPKVKQLENKKDRFIVHGFANDQHEVIRQARVMLAPIVYGAGIKGKMLDSMKTDTPIVTTEMGAEGIQFENWPGYICENSDSFIKRSVDLYTQADLWKTSSDYSRDIIKHHDVSLLENTLCERLSLSFNSLRESRSLNFQQSLLWQHQFQSSKYMSQWITAKNAVKKQK